MIKYSLSLVMAFVSLSNTFEGAINYLAYKCRAGRVKRKCYPDDFFQSLWSKWLKSDSSQWIIVWRDARHGEAHLTRMSLILKSGSLETLKTFLTLQKTTVIISDCYSEMKNCFQLPLRDCCKKKHTDWPRVLKKS